MATDSTEIRGALVRHTVYQPLRRGSAVAETVARLGQAIGMGLLAPGDRLPPEAQLAQDLGISAVTLRSALAMLRGAGLIDTQRGRGGGTVVADTAVDSRLLGEEAPASESEISDLVDYRSVLEGGAAALASERASDEQLDAIARVCGELEHLTAYTAWGRRDTVLHLMIADAAGSPRLVRAVAEVRGHTYRLGQRLPVPPSAVELADAEHRRLVRALRSRDPERARDAMVGHVSSTGALWLGLGRVPGAAMTATAG
jgi:DNA-binding FadR family transcriptional regulator